MSPLLHAAHHGHEDIVLFLLREAHASLDDVDDEGRGITHVVAAQGYLEILKLLLTEFNVPLDETDDYGWLASHHAAAGGRLETLKFLMRPLPLGAGLARERVDGAGRV